MKTMTYRSKVGRMLYCPVIETEDEMYAVNGSDEGFCLGCGSTQACVDPDAKRYRCESCEEHLVFGFQELLLMGLLKFEVEMD